MPGYVFISHAREDREYVETLATFLRREGIDAWFDAQLQPGSRFDHAIQEKIEQCSAFIVIVSRAANESDWVHDELDLAKEKDRDILPIMLDDSRMFGTGRIQCEYCRKGSCPDINLLKSCAGSSERATFALR